MNNRADPIECPHCAEPTMPNACPMARWSVPAPPNGHYPNQETP